MITHIELDIQECNSQVDHKKYYYKHSRGDEFQVSYFKSEKMMLLKCALNMSANLEKAVSTGLEKCQSSFQSQRRAMPKNGNAKECSNYHTTTLISHASKEVLKILYARLQQYMI